ncbi:MAG: DNA-binding protein [Xanthobacteraceae bacterium]
MPTQSIVLNPPPEAEMQPPLAVSPKVAWKMLDIGNSTGYELLAAGELESFCIGRARRITVRSIHALVARLLQQEPPRAA